MDLNCYVMFKIVQKRSPWTALIQLIAVVSTVSGAMYLMTGTSFMEQEIWAQTAPAPSTTATLPTSGPGGMIVQQGVVTSSVDPLPGHEAHQSATILRLSNDNAVYSGTLTFTATQPVEVQVLHRNMTTANATSIPEEFGALSILQLPGNNGAVTISNIIPQFPEDATSFTSSIPFSGNAVALHNIEGEPFAATYTVTAGAVGAAERVDSIGQAPPETEEEEEEEEE